MLWRLVKTLAFTVVVPGTVAVYGPQSMRGTQWYLSTRGIPGIVLFTLGLVVYLWCAWDFVTKGLGTPMPIDAPRVLVVRGLYRFVRNPMYLAVTAMIYGQAIVYHSVRIAIYGGAVVASFTLFVLLYEEPHLRHAFGSQYEDYCRKVPRWVPRVPHA